MVLDHATAVSANHGIFSDVHHGGTQINETNYYSQSPSIFDIFCQKRVSGAAFNSSERHPAPKCLPNTRVDVQSKIKQWFEGHDRPVCWLRGPAGSGKSALAQTIAEGYDRTGELGASFFLRAGRGDIAGFVPTLASQLAVSIPSTKAAMQHALQRDPSIPEQTLQCQFKKLVVDPILSLRGPVTPRIVVVDALDQCGGEGWVEDLITLLVDACQNDQFPLRFCLTSRPDDYICACFKDPMIQCKTYSLGLEEFDASDDIRTFVDAQCSALYARHRRRMQDVPMPWPSRSDLDRLVAMSTGLFALAAAIIKFVSDGNDPPHRKLQAVLKLNDNLLGDAMTASPKAFSIDHLVNKLAAQPSPSPVRHPASGVIKTGLHTVTNVKYLNLAVLSDANNSDVIANTDSPGEKWSVTLLQNKNYTIQNERFGNFATCSPQAEKGDNVRGREYATQWKIKETRVRGQYTISPTDADVFWGLADGESETPVTLETVPNNPKNQWIFTEVS